MPTRKVVRSFSVYVNVPNSGDKMEDDEAVLEESGMCNVLSYPLQSKTTPSPLSISSVQFKPKNKIVNMSMSFSSYVPLDADQQHKYRSQESESDPDPVVPVGSPMESIAFKSSYVPPVCNYAIGKIVQSEEGDDEVHLTPIHSHYMMRPGFGHINCLEGGVKEEGGKEIEEEEGGGGNGLEKVQYKKKESDRTVNARKTSFGFRKKIIEEEEYVNLEIIKNPDDSTKLTSSATEKVEFDFKDKYVNTLNYLEEVNRIKLKENGEEFDKIHPETISTLESAMSKIIQSFYTSHSPLNLSVLLSCISYTDEALIIDALRTVAVLVRGNWILKSSLTPFSEKEQLARDVIISLFITHGSLDKSILKASITSLEVPEYVVEHMLKEIAVKRERLWWVKLVDDTEFGRRYGEVEEKERVEWEEGRKEVCKEFLEEYERIFNNRFD